jgi:hypothetical protein
MQKSIYYRAKYFNTEHFIFFLLSKNPFFIERISFFYRAKIHFLSSNQFAPFFIRAKINIFGN